MHEFHECDKFFKTTVIDVLHILIHRVSLLDFIANVVYATEILNKQWNIDVRTSWSKILEGFMHDWYLALAILFEFVSLWQCGVAYCLGKSRQELYYGVLTSAA